MRAIWVMALTLVVFQSAIARKMTWEKDPTNWSESECQRVLEISPWCAESYKPLQGDHHYLIKAQWVCPVILCAEAREEQLAKGENLEFMKERFLAKLEQEGITEQKIIKIKVFPMEGVGMVGQNLHLLANGDPFFENLSEKIKLIKNKKRDEYLSPVEVKPLHGSLANGFQVVFENDDFISARTWRAELLIDSSAGEFKFTFEPRKMKNRKIDITL